MMSVLRAEQAALAGRGTGELKMGYGHPGCAFQLAVTMAPSHATFVDDGRSGWLTIDAGSERLQPTELS